MEEIIHFGLLDVNAVKNVVFVYGSSKYITDVLNYKEQNVRFDDLISVEKYYDILKKFIDSTDLVLTIEKNRFIKQDIYIILKFITMLHNKNLYKFCT